MKDATTVALMTYCASGTYYSILSYSIVYCNIEYHIISYCQEDEGTEAPEAILLEHLRAGMGYCNECVFTLYVPRA